MSNPRTIAACRPVDVATMPPLDGVSIPPIYPGSIRGVCARCRQAVWVGPKVQEAAELGPVRICCFMCAVTEAATTPGGRDLINLGNTFTPKPRPNVFTPKPTAMRQPAPRGLYYDRAGNEIDRDQMAAIFAEPMGRFVALDRIGDIAVSTVHLVINHALGDEPPLIFETMTFNADGDEQDCRRYSTEADALAGHEAICAGLRAARSTAEEVTCE